VVSVQLACTVHGAVVLIIRRSWVRAPPAPPNLSCGDARLSASCNPVVGTLSGSEGRRKYARGHGAVSPASGSALPSARRQLVACLALAAELAADWGIVPFKLPGVADWSAMFAADPQRGQPPSDGSGPGPSSTVAGRSLTARTVASRLAIPSAEGTAHTLSAMGPQEPVRVVISRMLARRSLGRHYQRATTLTVVRHTWHNMRQGGASGSSGPMTQRVR
jgi:hypothetical protein